MLTDEGRLFQGLRRANNVLCGRFTARSLRLGAAICLAIMPFAHLARAQSFAAINGASQYGDSHVVTWTLVRFEELVRKYYGKPLEFILHRNSSRGLERQYFSAMSQGGNVDYAIVSPVHMADVSRAARLIEAPFLFRDSAHWSAALDAGLTPFTDEIAQKAEVMLIGFAGGSARNLLAGRPVANGLKGLKIRGSGAPPWNKVFEAAGMMPTAIASNAVHDAIKKGTIAATEGDAAGIEAMRLFEVAPNLVPTAHAFAIRPICFSAKTFRLLPADLQEAILKAGAEAAAFGREIEQAEDRARIEALEAAGKLKRVPIEDRAALKALADPAIAAYAKEIGADEVLAAINAR
jgi:TRAP-type transport system periplasmic protein